MPSLPPINSNTAIVDQQGRPKLPFVTLINQLLSGAASSALSLAQQAIAAVNGLKASTITADAPLSASGTLGSGITISMDDSGVTAGTYGDTTHYPIVTVDEFGRVTLASEAAFSGGTIEVEQGGISKVAAASKLNFASGATVVQNGSDPSQADVTISGGGGGGGVPPYVGMPSQMASNSPSTNAANGYYVSSVLLVPEDCTIYSVCAMVYNPSSSMLLTPGIYDINTSNGAQGALLASGPSVAAATFGLIEMPLTVPLSVTAGQTIWIGFITDPSISLQSWSGQSINSYFFVGTAGPLPNPAPSSSTTQGNWVMFAKTTP